MPPVASVAVTLKSADPPLVGVPLILPTAESDRPRGSEPEVTAQV